MGQRTTRRQQALKAVPTRPWVKREGETRGAESEGLNKGVVSSNSEPASVSSYAWVLTAPLCRLRQMRDDVWELDWNFGRMNQESDEGWGSGRLSVQ